MAFDAQLETSIKVNRPNVSVPDVLSRTAVVPTKFDLEGGDKLGDLDPTVRIRLPRPVGHLKLEVHSRLMVLQAWEGFVDEIRPDEGVFQARLSDLTDSDNGEEIVELLIADVDDDDQELLRVGGVFRWIIGYREKTQGRRERVSSLVFRRLPGWSKIDLEAAKREGAAVANALQWE